MSWTGYVTYGRQWGTDADGQPFRLWACPAHRVCAPPIIPTGSDAKCYAIGCQAKNPDHTTPDSEGGRKG